MTKTVHSLSDFGATGDFIIEETPLENVRKSKHPLKITLPYESIMESTHTGNLDMPCLPDQMIVIHVVSGLAYSQFISIRKFCDTKCTVIFDKYKCRLY